MPQDRQHSAVRIGGGPAHHALMPPAESTACTPHAPQPTLCARLWWTCERKRRTVLHSRLTRRFGLHDPLTQHRVSRLTWRSRHGLPSTPSLRFTNRWGGGLTSPPVPALVTRAYFLTRSRPCCVVLV